MGEPPGADRDLGAGLGQKRGDITITGNSGRHNHAERGAGTSSGS